MNQTNDDSDQFFRLGPKALIAAISNCCWLFVVFCVMGLCIRFGLGLMGISLDLDSVPLIPIVLVAVVWFLTLTVVGHFFRSYKLDEQCLHSREGVIWYRHTAVPLNRVQHAEVARSLFERIVGLATLTVHTAGPTSYAVAVRYLDLDLANEMLSKIVPHEFERSEDVPETE